MGQVYKGWDEVLRRDVAIKVLYPNTSDHLIARFVIEGKALGQVQHPNIMVIHDMHQADNGQLYMIMDFIKGESLSTMIEKRGPQKFFDVLPIFEKVCFGLRHAHSRKVLHRDIKPSNVMISDDRTQPDSVKLVDFGLAKQMDGEQDLTKTGSAMGSPPYMSPEAVHGKDFDERSDIYSLGCMFFEMLTGRPPFIADTQFHTMMAHIHKLAPTLSEVSGKTYDDEVEEFVRKCMAKDPANRFQNMHAVLAQLERIATTLTQRHHAERDANWESSVYASGALVRLKNEKYNKLFVLASVVLVCCGIAGTAYFMNKKPAQTGETRLQPVDAALPPVRESNEITEHNIAERRTNYLEGAHELEREDGRAACRASGRLDPKQIELDAKKFKDIEVLELERVERPELLVPMLSLHYKWLTITHTPISADLWRIIAKNKDLGFLCLNDFGGITEETVACLKSLPKLILLKVVATDEKIENIEIVCEAKSLQNICLEQFDITVDMMRDFVRLPRLYELKLDRCSIAAGALLKLNKSPCVNLSLVNDQLGAANAKELTKLNKIVFLDLHNSNVDDGMFLELAKMKSLKVVNVKRTLVTPDAVTKMHNLRPDIQVGF